MKFPDIHFEDYLIGDKLHLHPRLLEIYKNLPDSIEKFTNLIIYGPKGTGKYTQMLEIIRRYSPTDLKYEKKISVNHNKSTYYFKISDIHFEIDMSLLGCNSKILWNDIFNNIIDVIQAKSRKSGIIVCKYFNEIHNELLDSFYSYMQTSFDSNIKIKYIIITEDLSFIPNNIINSCKVLNIPRPSKSSYNKLSNIKITNTENVENVKQLLLKSNRSSNQNNIICMNIINAIVNLDNFKFNDIRELLYDIFVYNLNVHNCIWFIVNYIIEKKILPSNKVSDVLLQTYTFLQYYNNNYRPIYHLESYIYFIIINIHGFTCS